MCLAGFWPWPFMTFRLKDLDFSICHDCSCLVKILILWLIALFNYTVPWCLQIGFFYRAFLPLALTTERQTKELIFDKNLS